MNPATMPKPADLADGYLLYLAALRQSGISDAFDTRPLPDADALMRWMLLLDDGQPQP